MILYAIWKAGFVTTWKTDNPGISENNQITIPIYIGEEYDYTVDWEMDLSVQMLPEIPHIHIQIPAYILL